MESQQKKWGKTTSTSERKRRKNLKNRGETTTVLPWISKTIRNTFKSLSNNQPTNSTTIFTQIQCGTHSKHFFFTNQMRIRPLRYITEDMKIFILPTVPIGLMQKKSSYSTKARNCGTQVRRLYLTKKTCELGFLETVKLLSELFSAKTSQFHKRWKCPNLTKRDSDDYLGFASIINKNCDDFKLGELSADNFKCLIFAQGLVSAKDVEIRHNFFYEVRERTRSPTSKIGWRLSEDSECQKRLKKYREVWCCLRQESQE